MIGPGSASPIGTRSTETTGVTSSAEPQTKTSSARYSSVRSIERSSAGRANRYAKRSRTVARVSDSRIESVTGGVISTPSRTTITHAPVASATLPSRVRRIASS